MQIIEVTYTKFRGNLAKYIEQVQEGVIIKVIRRPSNQGGLTAYLVSEKDVASLPESIKQ